MKRLLQPLIKVNSQYQEISFEQAFKETAQRCAAAGENRTLIMANGNYSNEELYLIQRMARAGVRTNALGSFDYFERGTAFFIDKNDILPFAELFASDLFICMFNEQTDALSVKTVNKILEACENTPKYVFNTPDTLTISHYAAFFRCLNYYLIQHNLAKGIYVDGLGKNYSEYKKALLQENFSDLLSANNLKETDIQQFVEKIKQVESPAFLVWERWLDARGIIELENLCMLLDIQAKPSAGFLSLKAELNSQGLFDMGIFPELCVGGTPFNDDNRHQMNELYGTSVQTEPLNIVQKLADKDFSHCLIFNGTSSEIPKSILNQVASAEFSMLQTSFWDERSDTFDLLIPAALPEETTGTFTDSGRTPHNSQADTDPILPFNNLQIISAISEQLGLVPMSKVTDIFLEYISFFKGGCRSKFRHFFR